MGDPFSPISTLGHSLLWWDLNMQMEGKNSVDVKALMETRLDERLAKNVSIKEINDPPSDINWIYWVFLHMH